MKIRYAQDRGPSNLGWLKSQHTFSFASYYDPNHMGFESLRVINDDIVSPGMGFDKHPHENMEIISYVLEGALAHEDSMGNGSVIRPHDVQRMSAGTGVVHSEFNHSKTDPVHFLQIWFLPNVMNITPSYEQKSFAYEDKLGQFALLVSPDGRQGSLKIHQDVHMLAAVLEHSEQTVNYHVLNGRKAWVHLAKGIVELNGHSLKAGDGIAIEQPSELNFTRGQDAEIILFDLAPR